MTMLSSLDLIRRVPLFSMLTESQANAVADAVIKRRFKRGEMIVEQGKKSNALFILLNGRARVVTADSRGREVILATLQPGDHSIVVSYSGDDNNAAAQSAVLTQTVSATAVVPTTATPVPSLSAMGVVLLNAMAALMLGLGLRWRRRAAQQPQ